MFRYLKEKLCCCFYKQKKVIPFFDYSKDYYETPYRGNYRGD